MEICPYWLWSAWGGCTETCDGGTRDRSASECSTGVTSECTAIEANSQTENCATDACPDWIWSEWQECTVDCGLGTQSRVATGCN